MQVIKQEIAEERSKVTFGVPLDELLARPSETEPVPSLVRFMITILRERALKEEGLFRISEKVEKVAQLRHNIDKGMLCCHKERARERVSE
jgi:regulator of sirC expression with transglutaminase-like and TPR domain